MSKNGPAQSSIQLLQTISYILPYPTSNLILALSTWHSSPYPLVTFVTLNRIAYTNIITLLPVAKSFLPFFKVGGRDPNYRQQAGCGFNRDIPPPLPMNKPSVYIPPYMFLRIIKPPLYCILVNIRRIARYLMYLCINLIV